VLYQAFQDELPALAARANLQLSELEPLSAFKDWDILAAQWLRDRSRRARP
jgi:hypothetical protein